MWFFVHGCGVIFVVYVRVCACVVRLTLHTHTHTQTYIEIMSTHRNITYTQNILDIRIYIHTYAFKPEEESHGLRPRRPSVERLLS